MPADNGFYLSFNIEGEQQLSRKLLVVADKVKDWLPAFQETADTLKNLFSNDVFASEGAVIEEHWSPLKQAYAYQKQKKYPGKGTLEATGAMRGSFVSQATANMASISNSADYFKYHQSNKPRTKLPRRVMMKIANPQKVMVVRIFHDYFRQSIAG